VGHGVYYVRSIRHPVEVRDLGVFTACSTSNSRNQIALLYKTKVLFISNTMPAPSPLPQYLYKILPSAPPSTLPSRLPLSDLDLKDGFIHLSTSEQVASTADKWFDTFTELWLLQIKYDVLVKGTDGDGEVHSEKNSAIKWEEVGRGCFAHFYNGDLGSGNVEKVLKVEKTGSWAESLRLEN
jgi:uncharacterized protein (DUF952 family)